MLTLLAFSGPSKGKKNPQKLTKTFKIEEIKSNIFRENFNKKFSKNVTYDYKKVTKKQNFTLLQTSIVFEIYS